MTSRDQETTCASAGLFIVAILLAGAVSAVLSPEACGQAPEPSIMAYTHLVLAQAAVAECGWDLPDCHAAVWYTLLHRHGFNGRRYSLASLTVAYCAAWKSGNRRRRARWLRALPAVGLEGCGPSTGCTAPDGWPRNASWPRHRELWRAVYLRAGGFLRGDVSDPCKADGKTVHFGGPMDVGRASVARWRELQCGDTGGQRFYAFGGL